MNDRHDQTVVPFGRFKGLTFDQIASTDEGLKYLDWLSGWEYFQGPLKSKLESYLGGPEVARELRAVLGED